MLFKSEAKGNLSLNPMYRDFGFRIVISWSTTYSHSRTKTGKGHCPRIQRSLGIIKTIKSKVARKFSAVLKSKVLHNTSKSATRKTPKHALDLSALL
jgi:hypothetical protein